MALPQNIYLMSFEPWNTNEFLIRLEHLLDKFDDAELSQSVDLDLNDIFPGDYYYREVSLAGNQWIEDSKRLRFKQMGSPSSGDEVRFPKLVSTSITLEPMQIRSFIMSTTPFNSGAQHLTFKNLFILVVMVVVKIFY